MKHKLMLIASVSTSLFISGPEASGQWVETTNAITIGGGNYTSLAVSGANLFVANSDHVFLSTDNGNDWTLQSNDVMLDGVGSLAVIDTYLFLGGTGASGGVLRSTDSGISWVAVDSGFPVGCGGYPLAVNGTNLWAAGCGVYLSTDSGISWTSENNGLPSSNFGIESFAFAGTNIFVGTNRGVYRSTNNGGNWAVASSGLPASQILALGFVGASLFAGTYDSGVFLSTNNGAAWASVAGLPARSEGYVFAVSGSNLFVGINGYLGGIDSIFLSTNNGTSWIDVGKGFGYNGLSAFAVNSPYLFASNSDGVWRRPLSEMISSGIVSRQGHSDQSILLSPNPTPGLVTIRGAAGAVTVTNVLGQVVLRQTGSGGVLQGSGEIVLDLSKLPAGTYYARIVTAYGEVQTVKLVKE